MHQRPQPGRIIVQMKDGSQRECSATRIISDAGEYIVIYYKRKAMDESAAKGWWPNVAYYQALRAEFAP